MKKDLLSIQDLTKDDIYSLIDRAIELKKRGRSAERTLEGYVLGLMFDKASTRTRVSLESAMLKLGGSAIFLSKSDTQMSRDETVADTARVLSRYLDALAIRTYSHESVEEMARYADIPVINALTDLYHPCQVLSDLMTVKEKKGSIEGLKIAWIGDGNNVANSWIKAADVLGFNLSVASPPGYSPLSKALEGSGQNVRVMEDPMEAARDADVLNTDVWTSMGQEEQRLQRRHDFKGFQVNGTMVGICRPDVIVMHCLPAHRGEEITSQVLEGPNSVVFDQAENKLYIHQAILEGLILR
ncbi:MAG: ornithine carbamoyltransferase [Deltaproteobacteria bacterium]|nr:ornithine carbamoyltransferase [Deltaproteobacteria bacterium]